MTSTAHRTSVTTKSKAVVGDNRLTRSPQMLDKLTELGVPRAIASGFPLTPHPTKRWCKKIKGKVYFFGSFAEGWHAAVERYRMEIADILAGRTPSSRKAGLRLLDLLNRYLHWKRSLIATGELSMRTWDDYSQTCKRILQVFGENRLVEELGPADFEKLRADFGRTWGVVKIRNEITRTKMPFAYAFEQELIEKPIRFGKAFDPPNKDTIRKHRGRERAKHGARMFEPAEIQKLLNAADPCMKAMVLLAANGGMGNMDLAQLPASAVNLETGWIDFPRPKTGIDRKIPLWPESIDAIKAWLAVRPEPKHEADAHLLFLTKQRLPWFRAGRFVEVDGKPEVKGIDNPLSKAFKWLMNKLELNGKRGFYSLRHGFETVAGDTGDQVAVDAIMGHSDPSMAETYRERIDPERLRRVVEHVRSWLFERDGSGGL